MAIANMIKIKSRRTRLRARGNGDAGELLNLMVKDRAGERPWLKRHL